MDKSDVFTVKQIQKKFGLSKQGAYNLVNSPDFPTVRAGRKILIPADRLQAWMDKGGSSHEHN